MKKVITGTFAAALFAVGVSAQTPAPAASQPMQDAKDAAKTATVTGCLKAGDTPDSFMLSDLKWKEDKAVGTAGTPATPPVSATSLKLTGSKLSDHVGHTVEVTGTIAAKADKAADPAARPAAAQPSLNVSNIKMVSATCQ